MASSAARTSASASSAAAAVSVSANSLLPMRPHSASAGTACRSRCATAAVSSSLASTPSWALTSARPSISISAKVVTASPARSASARSSSSSVLAWLGRPVSRSASPARRACSSLAASSPRARLQLAQRKSGKAHQRKGDAGNQRHEPRHGLRHRIAALPGEEADDAAVGIEHRLHFARARRRVGLEFEPLETGAPLDHARKARIDRAGCCRTARPIRRWRCARRRAAPTIGVRRFAAPGCSRWPRTRSVAPMASTASSTISREADSMRRARAREAPAVSAACGARSRSRALSALSVPSTEIPRLRCPKGTGLGNQP